MERDRELLELARRGNSKAMDALLATHEKQIYRFGLRMCGDEEAARDVLQETLLTAFRSLGQFRGDAALSTWLYQIARSICLKTRRRREGEPPSLDALETAEARAAPSADEPPDARAHARELGAVLQVAIQTLAPEQREVIVLRDVEGLSAAEAATVIGIEEGALRSRLHRARVELRQVLSDLMGDAADGAPICAELSAQLASYADARIDQATCARIEEHLGTCPRCAEACATLRRTVSLCSRIPGDEVPAPVRAAVRRALSAAATS